MKDFEKDLFNESQIESDTTKEILFNQYRLYVELADKVSDRRNIANSFFVTINGVLIAGILNFLTQQNTTEKVFEWTFVAAFAGSLFCWCWRRMLFYYKNLNGGKFQVIQYLEKRLSVNLFKVEWDYLTNKKSHKSFSDSEKIVPALFVGVYTMITAIAFSLQPLAIIAICCCTLGLFHNVCD